MSGKHSIRRNRRWPRRLLITTNVFVALAIVCTASAYGYVRYQLSQVQRVLKVPGLAEVGGNGASSQSRKTEGVSTPPFTMLIIGSDSRNLGTGSNPAFGNATEDPGQRSDSIILVRVVPDSHTLALFSIPRDTVVPIPGYGTTRINAAFNSGTPALLVKVLNQDFGIQVNHVAEFNFATFEDIANAIGGVYQYFPTPARDAKSDLDIQKNGCVLLNGATALAFARSRYYEYYLDGAWHSQQFPESDLGRIQRQQDFVKLAAKKAQHIAPTNPLALNRLISSLTKDVKFDTGFSNSLILDLVKDFRDASLSTIPSFTYPTVNTPGASTLTPETALGKQMIQQWLDAGQTATTSAPKATTTVLGRSSTPKAAPTTRPAPTTTIAPGSVAVEVLNGSGKPGQASLATGQVHDAGYLTTNGGNGTFGHARTVIDYAPDSLADAKQLERQLTAGATLSETAALTASPYNLQLITGQDYTGFNPSGASSSGTSPTTPAPTTTTTIAPETNAAIVGSATVEPDSSSFYKGQYIPPGRERGQVPQSCPT